VEQERQFTDDAREFVAGTERVVRELNLLEDLWGGRRWMR
jgi:hypothetical protein